MPKKFDKKIALNFKDMKNNGLVNIAINIEIRKHRKREASPLYPGNSEFTCLYTDVLKIVKGISLGNPHLPFSNETALTPGPYIEKVFDEILKYKKQHNKRLL
ncbi:hypothetical protein HNV12_00320 [Methanococcoides sp. SA1]|nr:hypothetical protein [Methanococcoides sp. SA1]